MASVVTSSVWKVILKFPVPHLWGFGFLPKQLSSLNESDHISWQIAFAFMARNLSFLSYKAECAIRRNLLMIPYYTVKTPANKHKTWLAKVSPLFLHSPYLDGILPYTDCPWDECTPRTSNTTRKAHITNGHSTFTDENLARAEYRKSMHQSSIQRKVLCRGQLRYLLSFFVLKGLRPAWAGVFVDYIQRDRDVRVNDWVLIEKAEARPCCSSNLRYSSYGTMKVWMSATFSSSESLQKAQFDGS